MSKQVLMAAGLALVLLFACFIASATATPSNAGDVTLMQTVVLLAPHGNMSISLSGIQPDGSCEVGSASGCPY